MTTHDRLDTLLRPALPGRSITVRNHLGQTDEIPVTTGTTELRFPLNLRVSAENTGGADHSHSFTNPDENVVVFVRPAQCRWCRKGYQ